MKRLVLFVLSALVLAACSSSPEPPRSAPPPSTPSSTSSAPSPSSPSSAPPSATPAGTDCGPVIARMSTRERLAQLLVVGVEASAPSAVADLVRDTQVGGIFIGGNATELLTGDALARVQDAAEVPVSVAVDDEGGRVQRLDQLEGDLPSAREMARTMTPGEVRELATERGRALHARGVTVNYAPILDLTDGPADTAIGDRSYSADPAVARKYAQAFAAGLTDAGVSPVFKHFPGHGRADGDTHTGLARTPPLAELRQHDLKPYEGLDLPGASVMVGHLDVPGLTGGEPASLSPATYRLLRGEYGFDGPVVTDDLGAMRAVTDRYDLPEAVLHAIKAGADQALWSSGGRVGPVLDRLQQAVASGALPDARVDDALHRVLAAKHACES